MNLPELAALFGNDEVSWRFYLAASESTKMLLALAVGFYAWENPVVRFPAIGTAVWFLGQAIKEAAGTNTWLEGLWQYPLLVACSLLTFWAIKCAQRSIP